MSSLTARVAVLKYGEELKAAIRTSAKERSSDEKDYSIREVVPVSITSAKRVALYVKCGAPPVWAQQAISRADHSILPVSVITGGVLLLSFEPPKGVEYENFAVVFGSGHTLLNVDALEEDFGREVFRHHIASGKATVTSMRSTRMVAYDGQDGLLSIRKSVKKGVAPEDDAVTQMFGLQLGQDRSHLVGGTVDGRSISNSKECPHLVGIGFDSLSELEERCRDLVLLYKDRASTHDLALSPEVAGFGESRKLDKETEDQLNEVLLRDLHDFKTLRDIWDAGLIFLDLSPDEEVVEWPYLGGDEADSFSLPADSTDALAYLTREVPYTVRERDGSSQGTRTESRPLYEILSETAKLDGDPGFYLLESGIWKRVGQQGLLDYLAYVVEKTTLPWSLEGEGEDEYNRRVAAEYPSEYILLHRKSPVARRTSIEVADLVTRDCSFVHVKNFKNGKSSDEGANLFSQAFASYEELLGNPGYRERAMAKALDSAAGTGFVLDRKSPCSVLMVFLTEDTGPVSATGFIESLPDRMKADLVSLCRRAYQEKAGPVRVRIQIVPTLPSKNPNQ